MIKTQTLKSGSCKVTFELDHLADAEKVEIVGDFNGWQPEEMTKFKNGKYKYSLNLDSGQSYQFRYRVDGERWENDPEVEQVPNEYGESNSAVRC